MKRNPPVFMVALVAVASVSFVSLAAAQPMSGVVARQAVRADPASAIGKKPIHVGKGAPVMPGEFRGDLRQLPSPTLPLAPRPTVEPEEPAAAEKHGPSAPAIAAAAVNMP